MTTLYVPTLPTFDTPSLISTGAATTVAAGWASAQTYASTAVTNVTSHLASLVTAANSLTSIATVADALGSPTAPTTSMPTLAIPDWVLGTATGLLPAVEQTLWDRARAREVVNSSRKSQEAIRGFASRGFAKPPGMLSVELQEAVQSSQDASSTVSRDIAIKQAEMEIENRKFAFTTQLAVFEKQIALYAAQVQYQQAAAGVRIEVAKSNIAAMMQQVGMVIEAAKSSAQVQAQLAASALSSVNLSGSISDASSVSQSLTYAKSQSYSASSSASADMTASDMRNSTSTGTSTSTSTATNHNLSA